MGFDIKQANKHDVNSNNNNNNKNSKALQVQSIKRNRNIRDLCFEKEKHKELKGVSDN